MTTFTMNQICTSVLTIFGVTGMWLVGDHKKIGWLIGLTGQALMIPYALITQQYPFILGAIAFGFVYSRRWWKWYNLEKSNKQSRDAHMVLHMQPQQERGLQESG